MQLLLADVFTLKKNYTIKCLCNILVLVALLVKISMGKMGLGFETSHIIVSDTFGIRLYTI